MDKPGFDRKRGDFDGTSSDNESVHHYADQHDGRIRRIVWIEPFDPADPCH